MGYVLYGDLRSGAFCVEAALAEAGAPYEFRTVSLASDEQRTPEYAAINPSGKMPALFLPEGPVVTETLALLIMLSERHPEARLLPPVGTLDRAEALRWLAFMASEIYPMVEIVDYPTRFVAADQAEAMMNVARERIRQRMSIVEAAVKGAWFLGDDFSAVDIYAVMFTRWKYFHGWKEQNLPKLCAIAEALAKRPAVAPVFARHFPNG